MKRVIVTALITMLLFAGCGKKEAVPTKIAEIPRQTEKTVLSATQPETTVPVQQEETTSDQPEETAPNQPEETTPSEPEAITPTQPEETTPSEPEETTPTQPEETTPTQPEKPAPQTSNQPEKPQEQSKPQAQSKPQQNSSSQSEPSSTNRPTSSATCKDTGSKELWVEPFKKTYPYEETDPERKDYLAYLQQEGNPYFYYFNEEYLLMYPGHTYGLPLVTSCEQVTQTTWESSDPSIATVNQVGFVEVLKTGKVTITATITDPEQQETIVRKCHIAVEKENSAYTIAELEQKAHEEAQEIAQLVMNYEGATTDLERIGLAAGMVHQYVKRCGPANVYFFENGMPSCRPIVGYNRPFGTLVTFYSSCAGDTRALGLVLEYMGFEWYHVNANQNTHQWCVVYGVDGQTAFADASSLGAVGYGERLSDKSNWQVFTGGQLMPCQ